MIQYDLFSMEGMRCMSSRYCLSDKIAGVKVSFKTHCYLGVLSIKFS